MTPPPSRPRSGTARAEIDPDVRAAFEQALTAISDGGAEIVTRHPAPIDPTSLWDAIALPESWASEGPLIESQPELVGADVTMLASAGRDVPAWAYLDAQEARADYARRWDEYFTEVDLLLTPTMPVTAFELGRLAPETIDGRPMPASFDAWCALALPANLAGLPAASVPIGAGEGGLPVGLQVMGPRWGDATVLRGAALVDAACRSADLDVAGLMTTRRDRVRTRRQARPSPTRLLPRPHFPQPRRRAARPR